jgi:hypothetical protein
MTKGNFLNVFFTYYRFPRNKIGYYNFTGMSFSLSSFKNVSHIRNNLLLNCISCPSLNGYIF